MAMLEDRLPRPLSQVVAILNRGDRKESSRPLDLLHARLGQPDVPDLPFALKLQERLELLLLRHCGIDAMELIQIDSLQTQPAQASFQLFTQPLGSRIRHPLSRTGTIESTFGGDHQIPGIRMKRFG